MAAFKMFLLLNADRLAVFLPLKSYPTYVALLSRNVKRDTVMYVIYVELNFASCRLSNILYSSICRTNPHNRFPFCLSFSDRFSSPRINATFQSLLQLDKLIAFYLPESEGSYKKYLNFKYLLQCFTNVSETYHYAI